MCKSLNTASEFGTVYGLHLSRCRSCFEQNNRFATLASAKAHNNSRFRKSATTRSQRNLKKTLIVSMAIKDQLKQVYVGIKLEAKQQETLFEKVVKVTSLTWFVITYFGTIPAQLPYAARAMKEKQELEKLGRCHFIRYGTAERNTADIYLPAGAADLYTPMKNDDDDFQEAALFGNVPAGVFDLPAVSTEMTAGQMGHGEGAPVVLFIHGGVWAVGDKWNYGPMAKRLSDEGNVVVVIEYSLFPTAPVWQMEAEVDSAWDWVLNNIHQFGGDANKTTMIGHSAGCQLAAQLLWKRARLQQKQPRLFVGLAGCYHILDHYQHEIQCGVSEISTMKPVMGGESGFDRGSPTVTALRPEATETAIFLPPMVLMHAKDDETVPWNQSSNYNRAVNSAGGLCSLLLYDYSGHSDFVTEWWAKDKRPPPGSKQPKEAPKLSQSVGRNGLPPMGADLLSILEADDGETALRMTQKVSYEGVTPNPNVYSFWPLVEHQMNKVVQSDKEVQSSPAVDDRMKVKQ